MLFAAEDERGRCEPDGRTVPAEREMGLHRGAWSKPATRKLGSGGRRRERFAGL